MDKPLLIITVQDLESVPVIHYKGEEVTGKIVVDYKWETKTADSNGIHEYRLEHACKSGEEKDIIFIKNISEKIFK